MGARISAFIIEFCWIAGGAIALTGLTVGMPILLVLALVSLR